jgi:hypothetical protein
MGFYLQPLIAASLALLAEHPAIFLWSPNTGGGGIDKHPSDCRQGRPSLVGDRDHPTGHHILGRQNSDEMP